MASITEYYEELMRTINCPSEILYGERNGFLLSLMVMSSYAIQADGRIMHSEMEFMRNFLSEYFGEEKRNKCEDFLMRIFKESKLYSADVWEGKIAHCAQQICEFMDEEQRVLLMAFLIRIVRADGVVEAAEADVIERMSRWLQVDAQTAAAVEDLRKEVAAVC